MQSINGAGVEEAARKTRHAREEEARQKEERHARRRRTWKRRWYYLKYGTPTFFIFLLLLAFVFVFRHKMLITVNSGDVAVKYFRILGGTSFNVVGHEGLNIIAPWDKVYIYTVRTQTLVMPMTVLSKNGLEVHLDAQIRFHPFEETVSYLHRRLGPDYVKTALIPRLTEAVQRKIGQFEPEQIYSQSGGGDLFETDKRRIGGVFVNVEDIALFNIRLPEKVQQSIQAKAEEQQAFEAYKFRVNKQEEEFKRQELEVKGLKLYEAVTAGIPRSVLIWKGIEATSELAKSPNAKIIVFGSKDNLPLMLGNVPDLVEK